MKPGTRVRCRDHHRRLRRGHHRSPPGGVQRRRRTRGLPLDPRRVSSRSTSSSVPPPFGRVVIASGLDDGDVIALRDPTAIERREPSTTEGSIVARPARGWVMTLGDAFDHRHREPLDAQAAIGAHHARDDLRCRRGHRHALHRRRRRARGAGDDRAARCPKHPGSRRRYAGRRAQEVRENSPGVSPRDAVAIADAIPGVELTCAASRDRAVHGARRRDEPSRPRRTASMRPSPS